MYTYQAYLIETLTNLHVGSGGEQIGIVDNQIQRDPVTGFPSIYASSLKGSLRDHVKKNSNDSDKNTVIDIFGGSLDLEADEKKKQRTLEPGKVVFFDAHLLTLPFRSSQKVYYNCTCPEILDNFTEQVETFNIPIKQTGKPSFGNDTSDFRVFDLVNPNLEIEDFSVGNLTPGSENIDSFLTPVAGIIKTNFALFQNNIFTEICKTGLPVIARNSLDENGISQNLWYEEFLPRRTRLWFILGFPEDYENKEWLGERICADNIVQIGANFSIGYGYCRIHKLPFPEVQS
ncbi:MAG TPA: type III-B CRISPR module RAMP protein Cmr4 [Flexilinea sp.]|nr:type III-B CRISPR module RAMP protein Cmr4 [Flexilinea sp.]HQP46165.1 type III-B CRISPR module RAMP protein Cmr4 [Flexilinea sp.]